MHTSAFTLSFNKQSNIFKDQHCSKDKARIYIQCTNKEEKEISRFYYLFVHLSKSLLYSVCSVHHCSTKNIGNGNKESADLQEQAIGSTGHKTTRSFSTWLFLNSVHSRAGLVFQLPLRTLKYGSDMSKPASNSHVSNQVT